MRVIDNLVLFLTEEGHRFREIDNEYYVYNMWARQTDMRPKDEQEVIRCLNIIRKREIIQLNSSLMNKLFLTGGEK